MKKVLYWLSMLGIGMLLLVLISFVAVMLLFGLSYMAIMMNTSKYMENAFTLIIGISTIMLTMVLYQQSKRYRNTANLNVMLALNEEQISSQKAIEIHDHKMRSHIELLPHFIRKQLATTLTRYDPKTPANIRIKNCSNKQHHKLFRSNHLNANDCTDIITNRTYRELIRAELTHVRNTYEHSMSIRTSSRAYNYKSNKRPDLNS